MMVGTGGASCAGPEVHGMVGGEAGLLPRMKAPTARVVDAETTCLRRGLESETPCLESDPDEERRAAGSSSPPTPSRVGVRSGGERGGGGERSGSSGEGPGEGEAERLGAGKCCCGGECGPGASSLQRWRMSQTAISVTA